MHKHTRKIIVLLSMTGLLLAGCNTGSDEPVGMVDTAGTVETVEMQEPVEIVEADKPVTTAGSEDCVVVPPEQPIACTMQYDPVCGCDGKTYGNACSARGAGVPRSTPGACGKNPNH